MFFEILERKSAFLGYKNKNFKNWKNCHFSKGPWFWSKIGHFSMFFFKGNVGQENVFYDILEQKKYPFQAIKTRSSKNGKIPIFPKRLVHGFGQKLAIFPSFSKR